MRRFFVGLSSLCLIAHADLHAQATIHSERRIPASQLSFLQFAPDARSAAMGEAGVALSADANAAYWNASKLAFAENDFGASASYTPWLRNLVSGMWLGNASAYKKLGKGQAVGASINYFNNGQEYLSVPSTSPYDFYISNSYAINGTYSKQFGKNFSMGFTLKYISSNLSESGVFNGISLRPARTIAGDLSAYYRKQIKNEMTGREATWSLGAVLSNFGGKINYGSGTNTDSFLPTTFKIGGGFSFTENGRHRFNIILDAIKLMVPTPVDGINVNAKPLISGVLGSFSDAPGGFNEELQEIALAGGVEYWYKNTFALRGGYYAENRNKGDRKFFTTGAGIRFLKNYGVDFSYLIPVVQGSPLADTFRVSASVYLNDKKNRML